MSLGVDFEFFKATDGQSLTIEQQSLYDPKAREKFSLNSLKPGEIGCFISHLRVWEKMVEENIPYALIMEDDIQVSPDLPKVLYEIEQLDFSWDLIRLAGNKSVGAVGICALTDQYDLVQLLGTACGTVAYVLSKNGATKLIKGCLPITRAVDNAMDRYWENEVRIFAVRPYLVGHSASFESTIGDQRKKGADQARNVESFFFRMRRRSMRLRDSLAKRLCNLSLMILVITKRQRGRS